MSAKESDAIHGIRYAIGQTPNVRFVRALAIILTEMGFSLMFPILRYGMGERRISPFYITVMSGFALAMAALLKVNPFYISCYLFVLLIASGYHMFEIQRKNWNSELWHSRFHGFSTLEPLLKYLPFGKDFWAREIILEPLFIMLVGQIIYLLLDPGLGALISCSGGFMVVRGFTLYKLFREELLDQRDAMIEAEHAIEVFQGKTVHETAGFTVPNVSRMRPADRQAMARSMLSEKDFATLSTQA